MISINQTLDLIKFKTMSSGLFWIEANIQLHEAYKKSQRKMINIKTRRQQRKKNEKVASLTRYH